MNKNFHRIIFNAARGLRMAVQETARSTGRGTSRATRGGAGAVVSMAAALAALASSSLHAQIASDRTAPGTQRPTVLTAPNGVPLVNIQTPSAAGVSRNVYRQFDVGGNGVILNNSRTDVQSQLGGFVQGNPWLARGPARVIVNEVRSADPSLLRGFVEVAGARASVVIANPAGISVDGGGFINVDQATLTTGVPRFNAAGGLDGHVVRGGGIQIGGAGLDGSTTDSLAILTRAFELSGALHATALHVVAGANQIDADLSGIVPIAGTGGAPAYAIDVARLGGMYAGHIALVVNEAGVGARNSGILQTDAGRYRLAGAGRLTLSASGQLENSGVIQTASDAVIDAANVANSGTVHSAAGLRIATRGDLANHGATTGGTLEAARLDLASTAGDIDNRGGTLRQTGTATLTLTADRLSNTEAGFIGAPPGPVLATPDPGTSASGGGGPVGTIGVTGSNGDAGTGASGAGNPGAATTPPAIVVPGMLMAAGSILNEGGRIHAGGDIVLQIPVVNNAGGVLNVASLSLSGPAFSNAGGTLDVARTFSAHVAALDNTGGTLRAGTVDIATTGDLSNRGGILASGDATSLAVGGDLDNHDGTLTAVGALNATIAGALDNAAGNVLADSALAVRAGALDNTLGSLQSAGGPATFDVAGRIANDRGRIGAGTDLALRADGLVNGGAIRAGGDGTVTIAGMLDNGVGSIASGRHTTILAGSLASAASGVLGAGIATDGSLAGAGDLSIMTDDRLAASGTTFAAGRLALRGAALDLTEGRVRGADIALTATTGDVVTRRAIVSTVGTLGITATGTIQSTLVNEAGTLSGNHLDVHASNLRNITGGRLEQTGTDALAFAVGMDGVGGTLDNTAGFIVGNAVDLTLSGGRIVNTGGTIEHAGTGILSIAASTFDGAHGRVASNGDVTARAGDFDQHGGTLGARRIDLEVGSLDNQDGQIVQSGTDAMRIAVGDALDNTRGLIATRATDARIAATALRNVQGRIEHAGDGTIDIGATASLDGVQGVIASKAALTLHGGDVRQDGGMLSARQIAIDVDRLSSKAGRIEQTGTDATRIAVAGELVNDGGTIASNAIDLHLDAGLFANAGGRVLHAGVGTLTLNAGAVDGAGGEITADGALVARVAGRFDHRGGITTAARLALEVGALDNRGGQLLQTGNGATRIESKGLLDNGVPNAGAAGPTVGGRIASNGDLSVDAGELRNRGGSVQALGTASLDIAVTGLLDNGAAGTIGAGRHVGLRADRLVNDAGTVAAVEGDLTVTTSGPTTNKAGTLQAGGQARLATGGLDNTGGRATGATLSVDTNGQALTNGGGILAATNATAIVAGSVDNAGGIIAAVAGDLAVTAREAITNTAGAMQAGGHARVVGGTLDNTRGKVTGRTLAIVTNGGALANGLGLLAAAATLGLQSGALDNDRGLIQSGGPMTIDTHGQALKNTGAAGYVGAKVGDQGGIVSAATLTLDAGDVNNAAGFIGAKDALDARTGAFANTQGGTVLGGADVNILTRNGATYDNQGGQSLATGNLSLDAGGGAVRNAGSLIRSGGTTRVSAGTVDNAATSGADQGIEGRDVVIAATSLDNTIGAIRADANATITSAGTVTNVGGSMSAGDTLSLMDPNRATPASKTLAVVNTNGRLAAGNALVLDAATFSGDGSLTSARDLSVALTQDLVNDATVSANGNLSYATTGSLTNNGQLLAGQTLRVTGRDILNAQGATMRGDTTVVSATGTVTNRGLIDGRDTRIDAGALVNAPTGRIYGDHLSIAAGSMVNDSDTASAGTLAARETLDLGTASLVNRKGALIFSGGDLHIGGALDAERNATGSAARVDNHAATIEALGDVTLAAGVLANTNGGVTWTTRQTQTQALEFAVTQGGQRFQADDVFIGYSRIDTSAGTMGWRAVGAYKPDTNSDDWRLYLLVPLPQYPVDRFRAYYLQSPARSRDMQVNGCTGESVGICVPETFAGVWYPASDPVWAAFGVAPPARELPADHPWRLDRNVTLGQDGVYGLDGSGYPILTHAFDHPVTQAELDEARDFDLAHQRLDAATSEFVQSVIGGPLVDGGNRPSRFFEDYHVWQYAATTSTPELATSAPAKIIAGGAMSLTVGSGTNDMSQILAGGALSVQGPIVNQAVQVAATTEGHGDLLHTYVRSHSVGSDKRTYEATAYDQVTAPTTVTLAAARLEGHVAATSSAPVPAGVTPTPVAPGTATPGGVAADPRVAPIVEVAVSAQATPVAVTPGAAVQPLTLEPLQDTGPTARDGEHVKTAATPVAVPPAAAPTPASPRVVRTTTPDASVPQASLFRTIPGAASHYLVEADPAYADHRTWLSSDYLLRSLGHDPATVTKRLGDGFYEQRLIREQVAQLTGYRYTEGFDNDEAQYQALMDAGKTFAERFQLSPGIALAAAQMAQLTSDIVWLVEQTVTLADGSTERVLVPQVYVRVRPGDIDGSGALLSGRTLTVKTEQGQGDVVNAGGTLAGRTLVSITADSVSNLGGRIASASGVALTARQDLENIGGTIEAANAVALSAGRDIRIASTTQSAANAQSTSTQLDRLAGVYVTNPGGTLVAQAGRDIALVGAILSNTGAGSATLVKAGRDISLDTVKTSRSLDITQDEKNHVRTAESAEVGTQLIGGSGKTSSITVLAGGDIMGRQVTVQTGGLVAMHADGDIDLQAGRTTSETDSATQSTQRKLLGKTTTTTAETRYESLSQGSRIEGGIVSITANGTITGEGVKLKGDDGVLVQAGGMLDLHEARDIRSQSTQVGVTKSGIGIGTTGLPVPDRKGAIDTHATSSDTAAATTVESRNGGALLRSGAGATLRGVEIDVAQDATVRGATVSVTGAVDLHITTDTHEEKKSNYGSVVTRSAQGVDMHLTDTDARSETSLARSTIHGANVDIRAVDESGRRGELTLSGTTVRTPGTLTVEASRLLAPVQLTQVDTSHTSEGRDLMWQRAQGEGGSDSTANYAQVDAGKIVQQVDGATIETGAKDSIDALARQPGMAWVDQLRNDPALAGKVDWQRVDDAYKGWDYKKEGLTPEGAGIVTLVVAYFTAGAASSLSGTVGAAAGGGMTGAAVGGAVAAGFTTLASQAAVAIINNQGNLGHALRDLGSSQNVKGLLTAMATGGVLGTMNMNPTGQPTVGAGAQDFMNQLGQNLQVGAAKAVIGTAINGGSLEENFKANIKTAFLDTAAAQTANSIGKTFPVNEFSNYAAHAIAGCVVGAARSNSGTGCGSGAVGAVVGEAAALSYNAGRDVLTEGLNPDTVAFASMFGGIAAAAAGGDPNIGASAAGNAAANNFAGAVARGASACLEVALCRNGVLTAGMAVAISAEIERTRIANPEMSDRAVQTLAVSAVLAHSVVDGVTSVYDAFVSSPQGKFDPETGGYGAGSVPKLPNNTGNTAPPPNYGSNTGGNQVVDENLVGQIHGGGYASGETPAYGGSTITPNNELVSSSLVMAVPAGDLNSINEALSGTMGAPPNIVRGGTTNVISEYPNGNWSDANNAFDKLKLTDVRSISSGYGQGRTGTLANGTQVTVRPSQDGRPTIQIIDTNRPGGARSVAEIRFEPK